MKEDKEEDKEKKGEGKEEKRGNFRFPLSPPLSFFSIGLALTLARLTKPSFWLVPLRILLLQKSEVFVGSFFLRPTE